MDKTNTIRYIFTIINFMEKNTDIINDYYSKVEERNAFLKANGIKVDVTEFYGRRYIYTYKGLSFQYFYYGSSYHLGHSFSYADKNYSMHNIWDKYDELIADGYVPQEEYVRSEKAEGQIRAIKDTYNRIKDVVDRIGGWGEIGGRMRSEGCQVHYDGGSVCEFSKDFVKFSAHTNDYPQRGWHVEDYLSVYFEDGSVSEKFYIKDNGQGLFIDRDFELIFGAEISGFGRYYTDRELFELGKVKYDYYRVRSYVPKELSTLKTFDNFEDAKAYAYKMAKEYAESVNDNRKRYAYTNPMDYADIMDTLVAYVWYRYDRGSEHIIFVQGEYNQ